MADESPASFQLCKSTPYKNIEARKCAGCEVMFEPSRKNQRYHNEQCRKKSENRRRRGPSFTERVIAVKGRKCGKCGSEREGRRTAFYWDPSEANIDRAAVLCPSCLKWAHRKRRGQLNSCKLVSDYAEMAKDERAYQEANGCCILDAEGAGVIDGPPQVINRSNLDEASRQTHPRELFCRHCEERLCQISPDGDVIAIDKREVVLKDRAVACSRCRDNGREIWTKLEEGLADTVSHGPLPATDRIRKVEMMPLNGRTVAQMLHDLKIAMITGSNLTN